MKPSVESLQAKIKELEQKCEELKKVTRNIFDSEEEQIKDLREQIARHKKGAEQLSKAANSIFKWAAHINGGEFKVPVNHIDITDKWNFKLEEDFGSKEYVLTVWGDEE